MIEVRLPLALTTRVLLLALIAGAVGCGEPLPDPERPITIVPRGQWSAAALEQIAAAAQGWNLEFGVALRLDPAGGAGQPVWLQRSAAVCDDGHLGITSSAGPTIEICPEHAEGRDLFTVVRHEIGHVLGLGHALDDPVAVMAPRRGSQHQFQRADHELFVAANRGFVGRGGCALVRSLTQSTAPPVVVEAPGHGVFAFWAVDGQLRFSALDARGAGAAGTAGAWVTEGEVNRVDVSPVAEGLAVSWVDRNQLRQARLHLPAAEAEPSAVVPAGTLPELFDLSVVPRDRRLFVAATNYLRRVRLARIELGSQPRGVISDAPLFEEIPDGAATRELRYPHAARFVAQGEDLLLVLGYVGGLGVLRVRPGEESKVDGAAAVTPLETLTLDSDLLALVSQLSVVAGDGFLIVATRRFEQRELTLQTVYTRGALTRGPTIALPLPSGGRQYGGVSLALGAGKLALAASVSDRTEQNDVFTILLDPTTLEAVAPWQRLSAADGISSYGPRITTAGDTFVVGWRDARLGEQLARTRCLGESRDVLFLSK